jgi:LysR family glycine cleavage system transcriptional activator
MPLNAPRPLMPSLKALRAFEAAARHESFLKAADELGVTAGAVAQQVRHLEAWTGRPLFERHAHGVRLTREAALVLDRLGEAFDALGSAVQTMRTINLPAQVRIAALPSIAQLWLAPRLPRLKREFSDLEVSVSALERPPNFKRDLYDLAIFYTVDAPRHARAITLSEDTLFPVCAPELLGGDPPLAAPADLARHTLLHDDVWSEDWARWLSKAGVRNVPSAAGPVFSLFSLALQAAVDGGGVLIGRRALVQDALKDGRIVQPFSICLPAVDKLALLVPDDRELPVRQTELVDWLRHEIAHQWVGDCQTARRPSSVRSEAST